jgi:hypothetical protein
LTIKAVWIFADPSLLFSPQVAVSGSLHIDDVSLSQQHSLLPGLPVLHASDSFVNCESDRAAAAAWLIKKDFQSPPRSPHSSCLLVMPSAISIGSRSGAASEIDITLALQLSIDRLENIRTLLSVWDGAILELRFALHWPSLTRSSQAA